MKHRPAEHKTILPWIPQSGHRDCAFACLKMITEYYGVSAAFNPDDFTQYLTEKGVSLLHVVQIAEKLGFEATVVQASFPDLQTSIPLPCMAHWQGNHYVVVYQIGADQIVTANPAIGLSALSFAEFQKGWLPPGGSVDQDEGIALILNPLFFSASSSS